MKIIHLTDLHITSPTFVPQWGETVVKTVNDIDPEVLIISGDYTDWGYLYEYEIVEKWFEKFKVKNMVVVPGNHDSKNEGYKLFEDLFKTRYPFFENDELCVLGLDSSQPDLDDGHIGRENYAHIRESFEGRGDKTKIITLHHHLLPIPGTGRERHIPVDAGDALKLFCKLDVNYVLSGHKHRPWIWKLESTYFITAGTATTRRLKGRSYPSFNVMECVEGGTVINEFNVETGGMKEILRIPR